MSTQEIHPSVSLDELTEKVDREVAIQAASKYAAKHVDILTEIRERYPIDGSGLLSQNLTTSPSLDAHLKSEVTLLRDRLRQAIFYCASAMEERKYRDTVSEAHGVTGLKQRNDALAIIEAEKRLHISCQTLKLTVDVFNQLNDDIISSADKDERRLFANAVLISELAAFVIEYMRGYQLDGFSEIQMLYNDSVRHIKSTRDTIERNRAQLNDDRISKEERAQRESENAEHLQALDIMENAWKEWVEDNSELVSWAEEAKNMIPALVARKNSADVRLDVLHGIALLRAVKENASAMKAVTVGIGRLTMQPLPGEKVRKLIRGG